MTPSLSEYGPPLPSTQAQRGGARTAAQRPHKLHAPSSQAKPQRSSSSLRSLSIRSPTSSASSSSSSRKVSSPGSISTSSSAAGRALSSSASASSSGINSASAAAGASSSSAGAGWRTARTACSTTVPHFGQATGDLFRSKNRVLQLWHWCLLPSSGLATTTPPLKMG